MQTVLKASEIPKWVPAASSYDVSLFCDAIFEIEYELFDGCIGLDYREEMIDTSIDYSNVKDFDDTNVYSNNELMTFSGKVYKSKSSNNTSLVSDTTKWELAPYFSDYNHNFLWKHGMAKWISLAVYYDTIIPSTYKTGNKGAMKYQSDQSEQVTVNYRELGAVRGDTKDKLNRAYSVLKNVILRYNGKEDSSGNLLDFSGIQFMKEHLGCGEKACNDVQDNDRIAFLS